MKYLKLFENNQDYSEIEWEKFLVLKETSIDIEDRYINRIVPSNDRGRKYMINDTLYPKHIWIKPFPGLISYVYQCEDEYFLVDIRDKFSLKSQNRYYKCDQINGLLELLKYEKIK